jgi:hypothetical protein
MVTFYSNIVEYEHKRLRKSSPDFHTSLFSVLRTIAVARRRH